MFPSHDASRRYGACFIPSLLVRLLVSRAPPLIFPSQHTSRPYRARFVPSLLARLLVSRAPPLVFPSHHPSCPYRPCFVPTLRCGSYRGAFYYCLLRSTPHCRKRARFVLLRALFVVASQARSIHISFAPWLLPKPRLFHFLLRAPTCRPAHSTTASFARLRPSQLCPFSSFFAPCLALLAHPSRDVFVRCFQRCRYGSSAFARAPAKIHQPAPASTANASNICSPHRTVPIPGREGARLRCAALASQDQWRGDVFLLGIFFVGTNLDIVGGRRGVVVVGRE